MRADVISHPEGFTDFIRVLSDSDDIHYPIFRNIREDDPIELKTIATGKYTSFLSQFQNLRTVQIF
jgi:hypothetical protein